MTKTQAIRTARTFVGMPTRQSSTSYIVYAPYRSTDPKGPSTELRADSYPKALRMRASSVASIALHLMGKLDLEAAGAIEAQLYDHWADHSIEALVAAGAAAFGTGPTAQDLADVSLHDDCI